MAVYAPDPTALNLQALISYQMPAGDNVVMDVASGDVAQSFVAGTLHVEEQPAQRTILVLSFYPQDIPGLGFQHKVLGTTTSQPDGTFHLEVGTFTEPVLVMAVDNYGHAWQPNTSYAVGDVVHPTTQDNYIGFVYQCSEAGVTGTEEPAWWIDTGSNSTGTSGTATFKAQQYYQPPSAMDQ